MKVGIKYCGGCNPRYDRRILAERVIHDYEDKICFEYAKESELYDVILVVCGCVSSCAEYKSYLSKKNPILACCELDEQYIREKLNVMLQLSDYEVS